MKEREEGRYIAVLLSTVLEKGGDGTLVAVGAGCLASYAPERHTRQRHFLSPPPSHLVISFMSSFSHFASDIPKEKIMRYKVGLLARSFIRLPACSRIHSILFLNEETEETVVKRVAFGLPLCTCEMS